MPCDRLEMPLGALHLLRDRVDIAKAALERGGVEDRRRAGGMVELGDDETGLLDRPGRGQPDGRVVG